MLNIKKYANGRFFNTAAKKYIKKEELAELIKKGEEIQVTLTKTGEDITETVIRQFSQKEAPKQKQQARENKKKDPGKTEGKKTENPFLKTDKLVKWLGGVKTSKHSIKKLTT